MLVDLQTDGPPLRLPPPRHGGLAESTPCPGALMLVDLQADGTPKTNALLAQDLAA